MTRRYDLDWLRIIAFGLLIFYHTGMFYVTWGWHVKSDHAGHAIEPLMRITNPWRLDLLFFISGVAIRFMADKTTAWRLGMSRFNRLFWPIVFGMAVIVAPQSFYQVREQYGFTGDYLAFYGKYLTHYQGWCNAYGCLSVPTWNHLWYVVYLLAYSLVFAVLWPVLKRIPMGWATRLPAWLYITIPFGWYLFGDYLLDPLFPQTHAFVGDWYVHYDSAGFFAMGVLVARFDRFFEIARKIRHASLIVGIGSYLALELLRKLWAAGQITPFVGELIGNPIETAQAIFMMLALIGYARHHLSHADGPLRRTLTEAIFPFYIVHQTIIVVAAYNLNLLHLPVAVEAPLLIAITVVGCWLTYVVVRRIPVLRPLFGMPAKPAVATTRPGILRESESGLHS
ncbi:acyltransferase family protein [Asticcacaulis solisilvae]|uniref:acyltransferase family protein n=1 Tax=Asticcacaulis solisilvae TaxID=1217274 RepID=UPI003FD872C1